SRDQRRSVPARHAAGHLRGACGSGSCCLTPARLRKGSGLLFGLNADLPRSSIRWKHMGNELNLRVKRSLRAIPENEWGWASEAAVFAAMIATSGLQEKTVAIEVGIDPSTLAKVKQGTARPSEEHIDGFMDSCGTEAWLFYWLLKRGYDPRSLRRFESDVERENRELREQMARLDAEREVERRTIRDLLTPPGSR